MRLQAGKSFLVKWSVVCSEVIGARIVPSSIRNNAINRIRAAGASNVATGENQTYYMVTGIRNVLTPNTRQCDFIARFQVGNADIDSRVLDDAYAVAWNETVGSPRLPTGTSTRPGNLFYNCSRTEAIEASGGVSGFLGLSLPFASQDYEQLCSEYREIPNLQSGNVVASGSIIDALSASRVTDSSNPALVGTNANGSTDVRELASGAASDAARAINGALGDATGVSSNDIKFFAYAALGIVGALVGVKVLKEVRKI